MNPKFPLYLKITCILLSGTLFFFILQISGHILAPIAASLLIAMLLYPVSRKLELWGVGRGLNSFLCLLIVIVFFIGLIWLMISQISNFQKDIPLLTTRGGELLHQLQDYIALEWGYKLSEQTLYLNQALNNVLGSGKAFFTGMLSATGDTVATLGLMPVYIFFFLYYRSFFKEFLCKIFKTDHQPAIYQTLNRIQAVSQSYVVGLIMVIGIVAVLNTAGLMILGIQNAIFFGLFASVLAIIPYVGLIIGSIFPVLFALITKDSIWYSVGVIAVFMFVQFLEGNFITPNIVGSKVSVNPLAAMVALLCGGALWGAAGMILFIPYTAIVKVICDAIEPLKPIGFVIGEPPSSDEPRPTKSGFWPFRKKSNVNVNG